MLADRDIGEIPLACPNPEHVLVLRPNSNWACVYSETPQRLDWDIVLYSEENAPRITIFFYKNCSGCRCWTVVVICCIYRGITFTITWYILIRNYKKLNSGKFAAIHELEKELPTVPYTKEWSIIRKEDDSKY